MNYQDAKWLLDLWTETYTSTQHQALLAKAESFAGTDFQKWDASYVEVFASLQFRLKIMEIRRRLSSQFYKDEKTALTQQLNESLEMRIVRGKRILE